MTGDLLQHKALVTYARNIVTSEAQALTQVANLISQSFCEAIDLISEAASDARIIISGMGKAGFIAQKISATLASTGFPSFFIHPADAVHGDLGRCTARDIMIVLSNSGETPEVITLLPIIKKLGIHLIAITASADSTLGRLSDIVLTLGKLDEVGPLGLAPTTSTAAMLALGDALAMTLVQKRGFTKEEFALFHPGGDLGRSLLRVEEIMRTGESLCVVNHTMSVRDVLHALGKTAGRPGAAAVIKEDATLLGIFTNGDLRRCIEQGESFLSDPIRNHAGLHPKSVRVGHLAQEAARLIREYKIDEILVLDESNIPVGLIDIQDLLARGIK